MLRPLAQRSPWIALALVSGSILTLSRLLTPAPEGVGTHTQLGLPQCGFLALFSLPCPACGLTTSFAHLARFELLPSLRAHPLGLPLFALVVALLLLSLRGVARGGTAARLTAHPHAGHAALLFCAALLAVWAVRLCLAA